MRIMGTNFVSNTSHDAMCVTVTSCLNFDPINDHLITATEDVFSISTILFYT